MKRVALAVGALVLGSASSVAAQSLEESFARLCADDSAAKSETCVALRELLMTKHADRSSASLSSTSPVPAIPLVERNVDRRWGFFAELPGNTFSAPGALFAYSWKEEGRVIDVHDKIRGGHSTITMLSDGTIESGSSTGKWRLMPAGDGSFLQSDPNGQWRNRLSLDETGLKTAIELLVDGEWITHSETLSTRIHANQIAVSRSPDEDTAGPALIRASGDDHGSSLNLSVNQPLVDPKWGPLLRLVDTTWGVQRVNGLASIDRFTWVEEGSAIRYTGGIEGFFKEEIVFRPGAEDRTLSAVVTSSFGDKKKVLFRFDEAGVLISEWYRYAGSNIRYEFRLTADGHYESRKAQGENGARPDFQPLHGYFRQYSDDGVEPLASQSRAVMAGINEKVKRDHAAEEARRKASGGGGLLGSLMGAAVGAYAGAAAGLDTGQVVGAMMKGASVTGSGPLANALSSTGDQLLAGGGASSALTGGVGSISASGANYPTRPNLAAGACSGFTEGNYRAKALEGGGDSQLNTMCGQAFEYYTMYKRAIAQGYSEADANRTYAAHEQSAQVASGFLSSHGAK